MNPSYGKYTSTSSIQKSLFALSASTTTCWPWRCRPGVWSSSFLSIMPERRGVDEHRRQRQVAGPLGRGDDEGVGAVDRHVHVEQAQRPADHAGGQVVVHRDRLAHGGGRVAGRVRAVVDGDVAEVLPWARRTRACSARPRPCSPTRPAIGLGAGRRRRRAERTAPGGTGPSATTACSTAAGRRRGRRARRRTGRCARRRPPPRPG